MNVEPNTPGFQALFESLPGLYLVLDSRLRIVAMSRAYDRATITTRESILGNDFSLVFSENSNDPAGATVLNLKDSLQRVLLTRAPHSMAPQVYRFRAPQAEGGGIQERCCAAFNSPVLAPDGSVAFIINRLEDVTELARLNQENAEQYQLIISLRERIASLETNLAEANTEMESFCSSVGHDLRAPLRQVTGFVELLKTSTAGKLDTQAANLLGFIPGCVRHMSLLIDALLAFSRLARAQLNHTDVILQPLLDQVLRSLEPATRGRSIDWKITALPVVRGDPTLLKQVFANLLDNALKFTRPRPNPSIEIGSYCEPGRHIFFVRDNGVGFNPHSADRLFRVFQRLHSASEFEGIGAGLANVRLIIKRHGGSTWAESILGRGTTVYFSLPVVPGPVPATVNLPQPQDAP
jgi:signal transduction histidine kinase